MRKTKLALVLVTVAGLFLALQFFHFGEVLKSVLEGIRGMGMWGPAVFLAAYIVATVLLIPGVILTLGAGVLYGPLAGSVLVSISATLGAFAAFLVGRYLARDWVQKKLDGKPQFKAVDEAVGREGGKIVLLMRLSPVFPFNVLNYAFGLTKVNAKAYFFASWIGMIPGSVMYVYIGSLVGNLASLGEGRIKTPLEWGLYGIGLIATVAVTVIITKVAKKALSSSSGLR